MHSADSSGFCHVLLLAGCRCFSCRQKAEMALDLADVAFAVEVFQHDLNSLGTRRDSASMGKEALYSKTSFGILRFDFVIELEWSCAS